ncbi:MAG: hypothetical protein ACOY3I_04605 [Verrucomicrobiota bacterium]
MIEFKRNGPFDTHSSSDVVMDVKIIGVGGAGINVVDQMILDQLSIGNMLCIDTDRKSITATVVEQKILVGENQLLGLGTGGDAQLAKNLLEEKETEFLSAVGDAKAVILVAGLGGGTGSGLTEAMVDCLRNTGVTIFVLGISPLACEGPRRREQAQKMIRALRKKADALFLFANDRILGIPEMQEDARGGFHAMNGLVGAACKAMSYLLGHRSLVQLNASDFRALVGECDVLSDEMENCWVGLGIAGGETRTREVAEQALNSPMLADGTAWLAGDRILACVEGGDDFSVSEFQEVLQYLKKDLPSNLEVTAGAAVNPDLTGALSLTLFVARSGEASVVTEELSPVAREKLAEEENVVSSSSSEQQPELIASSVDSAQDTVVKRSKRSSKAQKYFAEQGELPLETDDFRGRFEKSAPTIFNGQNLDQPTFLRLGIKIRV